MSLESEDRSSPDKAFEAFHQARKESVISYSKDFLLSLSELEICKKLPSSFDASILSEFEDASHGIQDRPRIPGSSSLQGYRRSEYGSSPPSRGDSGNYSRGSYGRWDSRSSGRSDRESDSQSEWDSDSSRHHGNQSWRSWQSSEHDGLLGSGSFPRPSGYASGTSGPKARANDNCQQGRSNEPYHPPRPYKAVPQPRRGTTDSYNDETFGSSDCTSQDRVEEERRRRASFEIMRKEQQRALEEKQKLNLEKQKVDSVSDMSALLDDTKEEKRLLGGSDVLDLSATPAVSTNDSSRSTILNRTSTTRPIVPPGFANTILEKNTGLKSSIYTHEMEVMKPEPEESLSHAQPKPIHNSTLDSLERQSSQGISFSDLQPEDKTMHARYLDKGEKIKSFTLSLEVSETKVGVENHLLRTSSLSETHESLEDPEIIDISAKVSGSKIQGEPNKNHSTLMLGNIFGSALNVGGSMGSVEQIDSKPDDTWTPNSVQSSKFAHLFYEEERKPEDDLSFGRPNDLLSLIVGGNKGGSQLSDEKATEGFPSESSHNSSELAKNLMSNKPFTINGVSQRLNDSSKTEAIPTVLTCEDLEQTILSEFSEKNSNLLPSLEGRSVAGEKSEQPRRQVDNHASQHLLCLLQKGTSLNQMASSPREEVDSDKLLVPEARVMHAIIEEPKEEDLKGIHTPGKTLTLETLFGNAFMQELQSFEAPVSIQSGSVGSAQTNILEPLGSSIPLINNGRLPSRSNDTGSDRISHQSDLLPLNHRGENRLEKTENWLGLDDSRMELNSSKHQSEVISKHDGFDEAVRYQLPEEEILINLSDPLNPQNSMFTPAGTSSKGELSSNAPVDIMKKLAAIGAVVKEERSPVGLDASSFVHAPYDRIEPEIPHHNLAQTSPPQFRPSQLNHGRPLFYPLDALPTRMNSQMKFMGPESMIHHDPSTNHQFSANIIRPPFPRPSTGVTGYDLLARHSMLPQMQMSGNYPPHLSDDFQRTTALPHPGNQPTRLMPELNPVQGFPFRPRQPNIGALGMPMPAPDINSGSNHPEAFQRLLEMELRAKSKQFHPLSLGHSQGMYDHELEMGFRYR